MNDLVRYESAPNLPLLISEGLQPVILPVEASCGMDVHVVCDTRRIKRFRRTGLVMYSDSAPPEAIAAEEDWCMTEPPGMQSFRVFRATSAGRYGVAFEIDDGKRVLGHECSVLVQDFQVIRAGSQIATAATRMLNLCASQAFIEIFCRNSGRPLGKLLTGPGQWFIDMAVLNEHILALTQDGFLHVYSLNNFQRITHRLTHNSTLRGRLVAEGQTVFCELDRRCYRLQLNAAGEIENAASVCPPGAATSGETHHQSQRGITAGLAQTDSPNEQLCIETAAGIGIRFSEERWFACQSAAVITRKRSSLMPPQRNALHERLERASLGTALFTGNDGHYYAIGGENGRITVFAWPMGIQVSFQAHTANLECINVDSGHKTTSANCYPYFLPTGELLTAGMDHFLKKYRLNPANLAPTLVWETELEGNVQDCCLHPTQSNLMASTPRSIYLIDLITGTTIVQKHVHDFDNYFDAIACSENDIIVGDWEGVLHVLDRALRTRRTWRISDQAIFIIRVLNNTRAWVVTEARKAHLVDFQRQVVLGTAENIIIPFGYRRSVDISTEGKRPCLVFTGVSGPDSTRALFLYPWDNISTAKGQLWYTPVNRVWADYPALLDDNIAGPVRKAP